MPALDSVLRQKLQLLEARHQRRSLKPSSRLAGVQVRRGDKIYISFSCNDYLGLSHHPGVMAAAQQALADFGVGAGASRLVTGNHPLYAGLEEALARYKRTEAACVFGSGYLANIGAIPALVGKADLILADRLIHACMIDAAKLSGATLLRFTHNNADHCRLLLEEERGDYQNCLILTETVFSMDGDRAPIGSLAGLAAKHDAWLMTDDAHGLGILDGGSSPAQLQMGTLSKAAGGYGGYVCASGAVIEYLQTAARSLVYSTALPPASVAASLEALRIIAEDTELRAKPLAHARRFTNALGLPVAESAVVPVVLGESEKALAASALLEKEGFLVAAIRPPSVPEGAARLRFAFTAMHEEAQVDAVAAIVQREGWICKD